MSETTNYARHVGDRESKVAATGMLVFFGDEPPMKRDEWHEWAFWSVPAGVERHLFRGKLVAEDADQRSVRVHRRCI